MVKKYKYPKNWFKHNLIAVPCDYTGGNCSACIFRNTAPKFCDNLACTYIDSEKIVSVYWVAKGTHANIACWPELVKFFTTTPKQKIRDISNDIVTKAVLSKTSGKSL